MINIIYKCKCSFKLLNTFIEWNICTFLDAIKEYIHIIDNSILYVKIYIIDKKQETYSYSLILSIFI